MRPGEWRSVAPFGAILLGNSLATQVSGIVAVSGFLNQVGVPELIAVWLLDYSLMVVLSGLQTLVVDRLDRRRLMAWVSLGFAAVFILIRLLFTLHGPSWLSYSLLYLVSDQQWLFFPLIFWVLAEDTTDMNDARRIFPVISSWGFVGKLAGIAVAALAPTVLPLVGARTLDVLDVNVIIYLGLYGIVRWRLSGLSRQRHAFRHEGMRNTLTDGWSFVRQVPAFRYLTMSIMALVGCDLILEFRFYDVTNAIFHGTGQYQTFYSIYRLWFVLAGFLLESLAVGRILEKLGLKNSFLILPITTLTGGLCMLSAPGLASALAGMVLQKLPRGTVDETARKNLQTLVPPHRRGRVSILMDSYMFAAGSILGCVVLGGVVASEIALQLPWLFYVYLGAAAAAALFALWCVLKMRQTYDDSLLSGRLGRRKRTSAVIEKLTF